MAEENIIARLGSDSDETIENPEINDSVQVINARGGNDTIINSVDDVSIIGGTGDDSIINSGKNVKFYVNKGDGNDTIHGFNDTSVLVIGSQGATLTTNGTDNFIQYTKGSKGEKVTLKDLKGGGMEVGSTATWSDSWVNYIKGSGFRPGKGNDTAENYADNFTFRYDTGDGDDVVRGFKSNSTLSIDDGEGTYSAETVGSDVIVTVGDGHITLETLRGAILCYSS